RGVDELAQLGEVDDFVEPFLDLAFAEPQHDAVDEDVLAAGDLGMESRAQFDERRDAAFNADHAARRLGDAGHELESRALAATVAYHYAVSGAFRDGERHVGERRKRFAGLQVAHDAALQQRALERRELPAAVAPINLGDVLELDRRRHTASANESRSR